MSWLQNGCWAFGADYIIRALNTSSRHPAALVVGDIVGKKLNIPELSERCLVQLGQLAQRRRVPAESLLNESPFKLSIVEMCSKADSGGEIDTVLVKEKIATSTLSERLLATLCTGSQKVEIFEDDSFGRGLRAVSRLPKGSAILEDNAILAVRMNDTCCAHCLSKLPRVGDSFGVPCAASCGESYCSDRCRDYAMSSSHSACCGTTNPQFGNWKDALEKQLACSGPDSRAALTCLAVGKICSAATVAQAHPLFLPGIDALRGMTQLVPSDTLHHVGALTVGLGEALRQPHLFLEEFVSLYALLQTNEFVTPDGTVLFPIFSLVNHSCVPNCTVAGASSVKKSLITLRDVQEGEQLTIDYNCSLTSKLSFEQRKALLAQRGFECYCSKCITKK